MGLATLQRSSIQNTYISNENTNSSYLANATLYQKVVWKCSKKRFFKRFQPRILFHIGISHLFCAANQVTGFYIKFNNGLKWIVENVFLRDQSNCW